MRKLFTSESVTEGHPDKIADQISDAVLDECLRQDPYSRVACETICTTGLILCSGEITTKASLDISGIARGVVEDIGYNRAKYGFDSETCSVLTTIHKQSPDIAMGVDASFESRSGEGEAFELGAGDQGMMFGYACDETPSYMPMPIYYAHKLTMRLSELRKSGELSYLRPDGKSQVTVEYLDGVPVRIDTVVLSTQHDPNVSQDKIREDLINSCIKEVIPPELLDDRTVFYVNPTGRFVIGGPAGDCGLTGRKIIVDTYGGYARHGGGAFSGKDPTKVDRSATYAARYVAKNIVASGLAKRCELQIAYAIGVAKPVSLYVDTFGTGTVGDDVIAKAVNEVFDLSPGAIIRTLNLRQPIYRQLASYGHMGREELSLPWERTDRTEELINAVKSFGKG